MADVKKIAMFAAALMLLSPALTGCNEGQAKAKLPKEAKGQPAAQGSGAQNDPADPGGSLPQKAGPGGDISSPIYTGTTSGAW
jgi:hypothetical protein